MKVQTVLLQTQQRDVSLNKVWLDLATYSFLGGVAGLAFSLVFKNKMKVVYLGAGIGGGIALGANKQFFESS